LIINELATPKALRRKAPQLKHLILIVLLGIVGLQGSGVAGASEDMYVGGEDQDQDSSNYTGGVDQGEGPPPLASTNPNTIPPGPTRIKIDGIEPEAGPNYGNYKKCSNII
jgi:hypothetical protein